jgi:hypothetical protein
MKSYAELNVGEFLGSPRHAHFFRVDSSARSKIALRVDELLETGWIRGKIPIINIQSEPDIVEVHDGNASTVAWLVHARMQGLSQRLDALIETFEEVIVLEDRMHSSGEIWHPYVPPEVESAERLQSVADPEQGDRAVRKAVSRDGEPVYFDDSSHFGGVDASETISKMADDFLDSGL